MRRSAELFHSAALQLTGWYLAIIMALSIGCSVALYHVSSNDLEHSIRRQISFYNNYLAPSDSGSFSRLRSRQLDEDLDHLKTNLVLFNVVVLVSGGALSYALARRTLRPIEDSLESQSRFTADASHELRTPLTVMQSEIEVALRDSNLTKNEAVDQLKSNLEEVLKLKSLSEGLLKLAQGKGAPDKNAIAPLTAIATEAIDRLTKTAKAKKITINSQTKKLNLRGDSQNLTELLVILLDNAIKYSPPGSTVELTSTTRGKIAVISIKDEGQGIKATDLPHIFDRFYRTDSSRSKDTAEGYGLGLAIAKKIADSHDGSIEVKSAPGHGSTFSVHLPLA